MELTIVAVIISHTNFFVILFGHFSGNNIFWKYFRISDVWFSINLFSAVASQDNVPGHHGGPAYHVQYVESNAVYAANSQQQQPQM